MPKGLSHNAIADLGAKGNHGQQWVQKDFFKDISFVFAEQQI